MIFRIISIASNASANNLRFINLSTVSFLITYIIMFITYLRFRAAVQAQIGLSTLYFRTPLGLQPYVSYIGLSFCSIIIFFNGFYIFWPGAFTAADFISDYFGVAFFIVLFVFWKVYKKTKMVDPRYADIHSGKMEIDDEENEWVTAHPNQNKGWLTQVKDMVAGVWNSVNRSADQVAK